MQVKKQQLGLDMEQQTGYQVGKESVKAVYLSPCLFNLYVEYIRRNSGLDKAQAGIKIIGRKINTIRYAGNTILMAEGKEELKSLFFPPFFFSIYFY